MQLGLLQFNRFEDLLKDDDDDLKDDNYSRECFKNILSFKNQAPYEHLAMWIGLMAVAAADLCLFASLSRSHKDFQAAFKFCLNAPSYSNLILAIKDMPIQDCHSNNIIKQFLSKHVKTATSNNSNESIINANMVIDIVLNNLMENRDNYMLLQQ